MSKKNEVSVISEKEVANMIAAVEKAQAPLGESSVISASARKAAPKLQSGAAKVVTTIATVAAKRGVVVPGKPVAESAPRLLHAERLREVLAVVNLFQQALKDAILVSEGTAWENATATYSVLRRMAKSQPAVAAELATAMAFFKKSKTKAPPTEVVPSPAAIPKT